MNNSTLVSIFLSLLFIFVSKWIFGRVTSSSNSQSQSTRNPSSSTLPASSSPATQKISSKAIDSSNFRGIYLAKKLKMIEKGRESYLAKLNASGPSGSSN